MLKKLQRRFVLIAMLALSALLAVQLVAVNVVNIYQSDTELCETLKIIADNNGSLPDNFPHGHPNELGGILKPFTPIPFNIETPYSTRYLVIFYINYKVACGIRSFNINRNGCEGL